MSRDRARVRVLGAVTVDGDEQPTASGALLLGLLALHGGAPVDASVLCTAMWADAPVDVARGRLRTTAWRLRATGIPDRLGCELQGSRRGWRLHPAPDSDAEVFAQAAGRALADDGAPVDRRLDQLESALALWGGPPVAALAHGRDAIPAIAELEDRHRDVVAALARVQLLAEEPVRVVDELLADARRSGSGDAWVLAVRALHQQAPPTEVLDAIAEAGIALARSGEPAPGALRAVEQAVLTGVRRPLTDLGTLTGPADGDDGPLTPTRAVLVDELMGAWEASPAGSVSVHVLTAPAGAGATTVLDALAARIPARGGAVQRIAGPAGDDQRLDERIDRALLRSGGRLLVVADRDTTHGELARWLRGLRRRIGRHAALVVRTQSSPVVDAPAVVHRLRGLVGADAVHAHHLGPLGDDELRELLVQRGRIDRGRLDWLVAMAGGNPGLAGLLWDAGAGPLTRVPGAVVAHLHRRLAAVPGPVRGAVLGATRRDGRLVLDDLLRSVEVGAALAALDAMAADDLLRDTETGPRLVSVLLIDAIGAMEVAP